MGFADSFLQGLMAGRAEQERKKQLAFQQQDAEERRRRQAEQDKVLGVIRGRDEAKDLMGLLTQQDMPRQEMPAGQMGPEAPAPRQMISIPTFSGQTLQVPARYREDVVTQKRAEQDAADQRAMELYRQQRKVTDDLDKIDLSLVPENARFGLSGVVDPKVYDAAKSAALLQEQIAARQQAAADAKAAREAAAAQRTQETVNKPLSGEAAKVYAIAESMPASISRIRQAVQKDLRGFVGGVMTGVDTDMSRLVDDLADKVGRIRSGGAVNRDEAASFKAQLVRAMDALKNDPAGVLAALDRIEAEANSIRTNIKPNEVPAVGKNGASAPAATRRLVFDPATGELVEK